MKISVTGYMRFKAVVGSQISIVLEMEKPTLRDALSALSRQHGQTFEEMVFDPSNKELRRSVLVLLNGQSYLNLRGRLNSELKDGDEIVICPLMAGG